jgi:hypothetical protein
MRVFGCDAAEIIPHAGDDTPDLGLGKLGKGAADVAPCMFRDAEKRANAARQRTAQGGGAIERQNLERKSAAPQASRRSAKRGALAVMLGQVAPIAVGR